MGLFWAVEMVSDKETNATFTPEEEQWLLHDFLSGRLYDRGLLCRLDDRQDAVVQIAPPLVAGEDVLGEIVDILQVTLQEAGEELRLQKVVGSGAVSGPLGLRRALAWCADDDIF
jgi:adenosylmethionine-8-amino-7-oxononanoate aminotransferase